MDHDKYPQMGQKRVSSNPLILHVWLHQTARRAKACGHQISLPAEALAPGSPVRRVDLPLMSWNVPVSWTLLYHRSFVERFFQTMSMGQWSVRNILHPLQDNDSIDPLVFPEQIPQFVWRNASLAELKKDLAWLPMRRVHVVRSLLYTESCYRCMLSTRQLLWRGDCCPPLCRMWLCEEGLENDTRVLVTAQPKLLCNRGL